MVRNGKKNLKERECLYSEQLRCENASTKGYMAYFGIQKRRYYLKKLLKKEKRRYFASGSARKPPFFQALRASVSETKATTP